MSNHTPAPWVVVGPDPDLEGFKVTDTGGTQSHDGDGANEYVATVYDPHNALVVAAAPEMLAELSNVKEALRAAITLRNTFGGLVGGGPCPYRTRINAIDAILTKHGLST